MDARVLVAYCVHGKVRAMMTAPDPSASDHRASKEYAREFRKFGREVIEFASQTSYLSVEEARRSDVNCVVCDSRRR